MRKRRVIIFDDEPVVLLVLEDFFTSRGYEVLTYGAPVDCPLYNGEESCRNEAPCGDIVLTDYQMPRMNGIELLQTQARRGCKLNSKNKALMTGFMDGEKAEAVQALGAAFFEKPLPLDVLGRWLDECEQRMDLSQPVGDVTAKAR